MNTVLPEFGSASYVTRLPYLVAGSLNGQLALSWRTGSYEKGKSPELGTELSGLATVLPEKERRGLNHSTQSDLHTTSFVQNKKYASVSKTTPTAVNIKDSQKSLQSDPKEKLPQSLEDTADETREHPSIPKCYTRISSRGHTRVPAPPRCPDMARPTIFPPRISAEICNPASHTRHLCRVIAALGRARGAARGSALLGAQPGRPSGRQLQGWAGV